MSPNRLNTVAIAFRIAFRIAFSVAVFATANTGWGADEKGIEKNFEKALRLCEKQMEKQQWDKALGGLTALVDAHGGAAYVAASQTRLMENVKRSAFYSEVETPTIGDLIEGDLISYNRRSGDIKLRYTPETRGDFERVEGITVHPLLFDGPYSIEISGPSYPTIGASTPIYNDFDKSDGSKPPTVYCGFQNDEFLVIGFGLESQTIGTMVRSFDAYIGRQRGEDFKLLSDKATTQCRSGKKFKISVKVGKTQVSAHYNGRMFMKGRKSSDVFGTVGFRHFPKWDEIILKGDAQTAWVQQIEDAAVEELRAKFEKTYHPANYFPDWFVKGQFDATTPVSMTKAPAYPGKITASNDRLYEQAMRDVGRGDFNRGLSHVGDSEDLLPTYLRAWLYARLGRSADARRECDRALAMGSDSIPTRRLDLKLKFQEEVRDADVDSWLKLIDEAPGDIGLYVGLATELFLAGDLDRAQSVVARALKAGLESEELADLDKYLSIAQKGPEWSKLYEYKSKNYHVMSDIDVATSREAARLLEEAYTSYVVRLKRVAGLDRHKFKVFLFSGPSGYERHIGRVIGGELPFHTAGLYSGALRQLFIWNQRDRAEMMRTVRHEGFHQYLDRVTEETPSWFNEGLAEYYEVGGTTNGVRHEGDVHERNTETLQERLTSGKRLVPLSTFIYQDRKAYYGNPTLHYPQAWAFVHFLRHDGSDNRARFEMLLERLTQGAAPKAALDQAFGETDLQELDQRFREYILGLKS